MAKVLLSKWGIEEHLIEAAETCGDWFDSAPGGMDAADIMNLALYHTVLWIEDHPDLPKLVTLALYSKLPADVQDIRGQDGLLFLAQHRAQVEEIIAALS